MYTASIRFSRYAQAPADKRNSHIWLFENFQLDPYQSQSIQCNHKCVHIYINILFCQAVCLLIQSSSVQSEYGSVILYTIYTIQYIHVYYTKRKYERMNIPILFVQFLVIKPIADQLEQVNNNCDNKQKEMQQKEFKIVELQSSGLSKDTHIKDVQATISNLQNTKHKELVDSVNKAFL